ncbi:hypothetical protein FOZ63_025330, partial [Perkinsus olseni]
ILHRDLKPQNILLNWDCSDIKIADFGLAREIGIPTGPLAVDVVTLWYRAPEALLGSTAYGDPLDVWSIGCIILEMLRGKAFVTGSSPEDQLCKIFAILGAPDEATWPEADTLPLWRSHMRLVSRVVPLPDIVPEEASPAAVSLADAMLKRAMSVSLAYDSCLPCHIISGFALAIVSPVKKGLLPRTSRTIYKTSAAVAATAAAAAMVTTLR